MTHKSRMKTLNVGIIGCGAHTRGTANLLLKENKRIRIIAVSDPAPESVKLARELF